MLKYWFQSHFPDYLSGTFLNFVTVGFREDQVGDFIECLIELPDLAHGLYGVDGKTIFMTNTGMNLLKFIQFGSLSESLLVHHQDNPSLYYRHYS